jgi:hypothetical protein
MRGRIIIISILLLSACMACRNSSNTTGQFVFPEADSIPVSEALKLSPEAIADISKNITSPVEIANLLQKLEVPFSQSYLASSIDANRQSANFDKALKLGILGADLGYLNIYERTGSSLEILSSIRKLAEDIKVGQFFDFETIKKLSQNSSNLDSLLSLSINSYSQIDTYLRNNDRGHLSALMIIGVWLEAQYLATQVVSQYPNKILADRIAEQKIILNDLLLLIMPYCNRDENFTSLCKNLQEIKEKYRDVKITYSQGDPVSVERNGGLSVIQTEKSFVEMTDLQLEEIVDITRSVRNKLILNN